jgi:hypothetical protein
MAAPRDDRSKGPASQGGALGFVGANLSGGAFVEVASKVDPGERANAVPLSSAAANLDRWCADDAAWPRLHRLYESLTGEVLRAPTAVDIEERIKPRLRRALEGGRLLVFDGPRASATQAPAAELGVHGKKPEKVAAPPPAPKRAPRVMKAPPPELTFIEIVLADEDGVPAAGERYEVRLPNGEIRSGTLDEDGKARVERIPDGQCEVTFPDLDGRDWRR